MYLFDGLVDERAYPLDLRDGERLACLPGQSLQVGGHRVGQGVVVARRLLFLKWDEAEISLGELENRTKTVK